MAAVVLTLMVVILRAHIAHQTQPRRLKAQQSPTACAMLASIINLWNVLHARLIPIRPWAALAPWTVCATLDSIKILWNVLHARLIPIRPWAALAQWTVCATLDSQGKAVGCAI